MDSSTATLFGLLIDTETEWRDGKHGKDNLLYLQRMTQTDIVYADTFEVMQ